MASLWNSMFDLLPEWQWSDRLCWTTQNLESLLAQCLWHWHRNLISKNSHNTVKEQIWCHVCCSNIENMTTSDRLTVVTAKVHNSTKTLECFDNIALTEFNCVHFHARHLNHHSETVQRCQEATLGDTYYYKERCSMMRPVAATIPFFFSAPATVAFFWNFAGR